MLSFVGLCVLLGIGHYLRIKVKLFQKLYLPSSVIAGLLGLVIIQCTAYFASHSEVSLFDSLNAAFTQCAAPWSKLPGFLINIVFACLFLGVALPKLSTLWHRAGPQVAYGQTVAWGQYVVGIGLFLAVIKFLYPELPDMFAGILPVGFEGGHGTAAGLGPVFEQYNFQAGKDFALTSATFGILSAIIFGMILINWAARKGYVTKQMLPENIEEDESFAIIPVDRRPIAGRLTVRSDLIESLTIHIAIVGIAILLGYLMKQGLLAIEGSSEYLSKHKLLAGFPLFPLCMIGGLIVQFWEDRFDKKKIIDVGLMKRIQNTALDFLVAAAIATIRLDIVMAGLVPLIILAAAGVAWNIFCVTFLARRMLPDAWFERAIAEMGQSMGVTATGLMLLRVVDPDYETPAADAFACKQLIHEPFMGGGLWTGMAIPLLAIYGGIPVLAISTAMMSAWLIIVFTSKKLKASKSI